MFIVDLPFAYTSTTWLLTRDRSGRRNSSLGLELRRSHRLDTAAATKRLLRDGGMMGPFDE
jgi:hypothetical protein